MGQGTNSTGGTNPFQFSGGAYTQQLPDIAQAYMRSFGRGGPIDVPSYQELYGSYRNVAEREAGRQSAALTEAMGSQGARYGSDILGAQGRLRQNLAQDLNLQSGNLLQSLRQQQFGEASSLAGLQAQLGESGMNRMFQNYLQSSAPPPMLQMGMGFQPAQPTTIAY